MINLEEKINYDNLIYKYKTKRISPKDFSNYQNPMELFKDLRDSNINRKEVLKDQINLNPDLDKIKKWNPKSKSKDQISIIQNVEKFIWFKGKDYWFFSEIILVCYLKLNTKQNMEEVSKY